MPVLALFAPSASQCFAIAGPVVAALGLVWLIRHGDEVVEEVFPQWEWEKRLGWLNLRAHRRAELMLRWVNYFVQAGLLVALLGLLWNASLLGDFDDWATLFGAGFLFLHVSMVAACLALWIVYLVLVLAPRIRDEYEQEELERFRQENADPDEEVRALRARRASGITIWESDSGQR